MQDERTDAISKAIAILRNCNNKWKQLALIADNCGEEINAMEEYFPGNNNNNHANLYSKFFHLHIKENPRIAFCTFATLYYLLVVIYMQLTMNSSADFFMQVSRRPLK